MDDRRVEHDVIVEQLNRAGIKAKAVPVENGVFWGEVLPFHHDRDYGARLAALGAREVGDDPSAAGPSRAENQGLKLARVTKIRVSLKP